MVNAKAVAAVVGEVVAEIARQELGRDSERGGLVLFKNFGPDVVAAAIAKLEGSRLSDGRTIRPLVIAHSKIEGIPDRYLLPEDRSSTSFRNDQDGDCAPIAFFELIPYSDRQSLGKVVPIDDRSVLIDQSRHEHLIAASWRNTCPREMPIPSALCRSFGEVYEGLSDARTTTGHGDAPVALRPWTEFLVAACLNAAKKGLALDEQDCLEAVERAIAVLGLLPDPGFSELKSGTSRIRRVTRNSYYSESRDRSGNETDPDQLVERAKNCRFVRPDGTPHDEQELVAIVDAISARAYDRQSKPALDFGIWDQLYAPKQRKRGLGQRVREYIEQYSPERIDDLIEADVIEGLDQGEPHIAQQFRDAEGAPSLFELLEPSLARAVEKCAAPTGKQTTDPLRDLARELYAMISENNGATPSPGEEDCSRCIVIGLDSRAGNDCRHSAALFSFLYGPCLAEALLGNAHGPQVEISPDLLSPAALFSRPRSSDEDENQDWEYPELRISIGWKDAARPYRWLEWKPERDYADAAFARLLWCGDIAWWSGADIGFEDWLRALACGDATLSAVRDAKVPPGGPTQEWLELRKQSFAELKDGLSSLAIRQYVDAWSSLLAKVAKDFVPRGAPPEEVEAFLRVDTFRSNHGRRGECVLLATHPLKLRWFADHLDEMGKLLTRITDGSFQLVSVNDNFYFDRLKLISARDQPALLTADAALHLGVRSIGGHEIFAKVKESGRDVDDWLSDLDDEAVIELASVVEAYVEAFPHTRDGLELMVVLQNGGSHVLNKLVRHIRVGQRRRSSPLRLSLRVVAPRASLPELELSLAEFDDVGEKNSGDFPRLSVEFRPWDKTDALPDAELVNGGLASLDLAIVPNLFGAYSRALDVSKHVDGYSGSGFRPWCDAPTELRPSEDGVAHASRELLPRRRDLVLENWSNINVRHFRGQPVGDVGPDIVDYLALQVQVDKGSTFFEKLHKRARWVVTLDEFVGREQVEALRSRPDVISVRTGIGRADAYTLIVSSQDGRDFVVDRLAWRLQQYVPNLASQATSVAEELYERARVMSPGLLLRASGLGRSTQELVGLVVARWQTARQFPLDSDGRAFEAWLPLDEHTDWFGKVCRLRADLIRIAGWWSNDSLKVKAWVVEAKLRNSWSTDHADKQIKNTISLFEHALHPGEDAPVDCDFWRRAILSAVEQSSKQRETTRGEARREYPSFVAWSGQTCQTRMEAQVREAWLDGAFVLESVEGVVCTIHPEDEFPPGDSMTPGGYNWIQLARRDLERVLKEMSEPASDDPGPLLTKRESNPAGEKVAPPQDPLDGHERPSENANLAGSIGESRSAVLPSQNSPSEDSARRSEYKYQLLLDTFSNFGVSVRRPDSDPYREGPGFYLFRVMPGKGVRADAVKGCTEEIKLRLGLPADFKPRAYVDSGAVVFEVPKPDSERTFVEASSLWEGLMWPDDALVVPLGKDIGGNVVTLDFSSSDSPHLLLAGTTGSGKSVVLETILSGLTRHYGADKLKLVLVDPKGTELNEFETAPHLVCPIGLGAQDAVEYLGLAVEEMERRQKEFRGVRARSLPEYVAKVPPQERLPWWLVVLDEYADLTSDKDDRKKIEANLQRLSQKARAAGIHVIVATQKPSAEIISTTIRSNLPAQLALRVKTASDSRIIMDDVGAESLAGKGDAFLKTARGMIRLQCARVKRS